MRTNYWNAFDQGQHLQPKINKADFDQLKGWDFGWLLLEPINIAKSEKHEVELSKKFSPGQKALYFFWFLESYAANGGFIDFYWGGYDQYLPPIQDGLRLIGDQAMLNLIEEVESTILNHKDQLLKFYNSDDMAGAYKAIPSLIAYNKKFLSLHDQTIELLEAYARKNIQEFALLS